MMNWTDVIIAVATAVIAVYSGVNYKLAYQLKKNEEKNQELNRQYQQQTKDLFQAITIATLLSNSNFMGQYINLINNFKTHYKGKTPIFD